MPACRVKLATQSQHQGLAMQVTIDLTPFELETLHDFRRYHAQSQRTPSSAPELELTKLYSALSTSAQILAEALDKAAHKQGV
jgi:hypothetical protein